MAYTNRKFRWDFDMLKRFYDNYVKKAIVAIVDLTAAEQKQARVNLGFGNGDIDEEPTPNSDNLVKSGGVFDMLDTVAFNVDTRRVDYNLEADGKFGTNTTYFHAAIKVNAGEKYLIRNVQPDTATESFTRYAFATSDVATAGGDVPLVQGYSVVVVPLWKGEIVTIPEGCDWLLVNYREGNTSTLYPLYVRKIVIGESESLFRQLLTRSISWNNWYVVDYNHIYNNKGGGVNAYQFNREYNTIIIPLPRNAMCVTLPNNFTITFARVFSAYEIKQDYEFGSAYQNTYIVNGRKEIWFTDKYTEDGIIEAKMMCFRVKKSDNPDLDYDNISVGFKFAPNYEGEYKSYTGLMGKKVSILGASTDTYMGYSYGMKNGQKETSNRYPGWLPINDRRNNDVYHVSQTWWKQIIDRCGATLERNNSIGGSGVSYYSEVLGSPDDRGLTMSRTCFLNRYDDLGNPDVIFIHGLGNEHNDITFTDTLNKTTEELEAGFGTAENPGIYFKDLAASYDYLTRKLMETYPNARIIHFLGKSRAAAAYAINIAEHYNQEYVDIATTPKPLPTIGDGVHSNRVGMAMMADYIIYKMTKYVQEQDFATKEELVEVEADLDDAVKTKELAFDDPEVESYIADENGRVFAEIHKDGSIEKLVKTAKEKNQEELLAHVSSESLYEDEDVLKYLTDEKEQCFGYIRKDGTVVLYKLEVIEKEEDDDKKKVTEEKLASILGLLSVGVDNIEMSNNPRMMAVLNNLFTEKAIEINGINNNKVNLKPCLSIIDDDTVDYMISSPTADGKRGGFFSVLLPMMLSLAAKHGITMPVGLACEGHRVGLTPYGSADDSYTELNKTGNAIKWLHNNMGWNVFNHSMTAQLPEHTYYVDGIESELADIILSRGQYYNNTDYSFWNTIVLDRLTGKWYECRKQNGTKYWAERIPFKKYAMPFYRKYINPDDASANHDGPWYFNRDFDFDYSWGEWFKRADELGLPYERVIVHNGGTSHVYTAAAGRKYAYFSVRTSGIYNYPPIPATVNRADGDPSGFSSSDGNVYCSEWVEKRKEQIDDCIANNYWMILMTHFNDSLFSNYYVEGKVYPGKDESYPEEWILPLKVVYSGGVVVEDEIQSIMDGTHDYIHTPPARLGINTWSQWHPAPGTHLAGLYELLDYALTQGVDFVSPWDGWKIFGNILNIGVDKMNQSYSFNAEDQTPYTDEEKSYLTIGADMSIRYYNSKKKN